jgi:outer membrane cobalamin receptor
MIHTLSVPALFLVHTFLAAAPAPAAAIPPDPGELVVTGRRLGSGSGPEPYDGSTLGADEIDGLASLADALQLAGDVQVQQPGGRGGFASLYVRGADPNFTTVMFDGVPLNDSTNSRGGAVNVSELSPLGLLRIELVRGPLSSLYGSGALAGGVDLVVPGGREDVSADVLAGAGSQGDHVAMAQLRGPLWAGGGGSLTAIDENAGDLGEGTRFRARTLFGKIAPLADGSGRSGRLVFRLSDTRSAGFPDNSGGARFAVLRETDRRSTKDQLVGLGVRLWESGPVRADAAASLSRRRDVFATPGVAASAIDPFGLPAGSDETSFTRAIAQLTVRYSPSGEWQWLAGAEAQRESGRSDGLLSLFGFDLPTAYRLERWTASAFAEANREGRRWQANLGLRVDRPDGLGTRLTGRAGLAYRLPGAPLVLRLAAGTGFKAPSFYALGNPFVGNPGLSPEKSRSVEAGARWRFGAAGAAGLTLFRTTYSGLIDFVAGPPPRLENLSRVRIWGASLDLRAPLTEGLGASANLALVDVRNAESGAALLNRPKWRGNAALDWRPGANFRLVGRLTYVGERDDFSIPTGRVTLGGYALISGEAEWKLSEALRAAAVLEDALASRGEDAVGFPAPGRSLRFSLRQRF